MEYAIELERDTNGTYLVNFPDFPNVHSVGDDEGEALLNAADALETALDAALRSRQPFPSASKTKGTHTVCLGAQASAKAELHNLMLGQGVRKSDLARLLHLHMPQVDRLLDVRHSTKLETLEAAFAVLGKRLEVRVA
jgi:antitoxin HicB